MRSLRSDFHVHIGKAKNNWVKMASSANLTLENIATYAAFPKGMDWVGIVDCGSKWVQEEWQQGIHEGRITPLPLGGYQHQSGTFLLPGIELETREENGGLVHVVFYFPDIEKIQEAMKRLDGKITNPNLSTQNVKISLQELILLFEDLPNILIPAHIFTPYKSLLGRSCRRISELIASESLDKISAIELGLSGDRFLADRIAELSNYPFLTNSDSHSLENIGREHNLLQVEEGSFQELQYALAGEKGRKILANWGFHPSLGKYHLSACRACGAVLSKDEISLNKCAACGKSRLSIGVYDRIEQLADYSTPQSPPHRPPYHYQIPLKFFPGIGPKKKDQLYREIGTESQILFEVSEEQLIPILGIKIAKDIIASRSGNIKFNPGAGGRYGKVVGGDRRESDKQRAPGIR